MIGISLEARWREPLRKYSPGDWDASERAIAFDFALFAHPVFSDGDYPKLVKDSIKDGRLPVFTKEEMAYLRG